MEKTIDQQLEEMFVERAIFETDTNTNKKPYEPSQEEIDAIWGKQFRRLKKRSKKKTYQ